MLRRIVLHTFLAAVLTGAFGALYQETQRSDGIAGPIALLTAALPRHGHDHDDD